MEFRYNKSSKIFIGISIILVLLYAFTISHVDCNTITTWAYDLLESITKGIIRDYPVYTYENHGMATNYPLFSNLFNAIWLIPVYLIDKLAGLELSLVLYDVWFKVLIVIAALVSVVIMNKVLKNYSVREDRKNIALLVMSTSSILLLTVVGKGQIDIFDMLCVILAIYFYSKEHITASFLIIGLGCVFKPFIILVGIPYLLLMVGKCRWKTIINGMLLCLPYVVNMTVEKVLMPRYAEMKDITSEQYAELVGQSRVEQIFQLRINGIIVLIAILVVICFICLYKGIRNKVGREELLFYPAIAFMVFMTCVDPGSVYWIACILPLIVLMGISHQRVTEFLVLDIGINAGALGLIAVNEQFFMPSMRYSLLDSLANEENIKNFFDKIDGLEYASYIFATILVTAILLICVVYIYERKRDTDIEGRENKYLIKALSYLSIVPQIVYLLFVYIVE